MCVILIFFSPFALAADVDNVGYYANLDSSDAKRHQVLTMERMETIVYGEASTGSLAERLNIIEIELFGENLPKSISERHTAILNFLEVGTLAQPHMLFRLGIVEWLTGEPVQARMGALRRVERLENNLDGTMQCGRPLAMRVERLLSSILPERITSQEVLLPAGTLLQARFLEELRLATVRAGDKVFLALDNDLLIDSVLIAPRGSLIDASVRSVRQYGRFGRRGRINIGFSSLISLGTQRIDVFESDVPVPRAPVDMLIGRSKPASIIHQGDIIFLETSDDVHVSGFQL